MNLRILFHNHCFDGACSASLFTRFHQQCIDAKTVYSYRGLVHRPGGQLDSDLFTGPAAADETAIVDFKYSPSERLTWWFDHHRSAFLTPEDHAQFLAQQRDGTHALRHFFDPDSISCTGFIARIGATKFGFDVAPYAELIHWANIVDGAKYDSAKSAVEMAEPAMQLTLAIESSPDPALIPRLIPLLTEMPLQQVLDEPFVAAQIAPLLERHREALALIGQRAMVENGVLTFDITDHPTEGYSKFIPYYLHPEATYVVGLSKSSFRTKISVGTNPWTPLPAEQLIDLSKICERYGGGGHARVGAISFPPDREQDARRATAEILVELRAGNPSAAI